MAERTLNDLVGGSVEQALTRLRQGGIVAFPTETYYGLAVDPFSSSAVAKLFQIKKRQADKPLLLLIEKREQLPALVNSIPPEYIPLMDKYWPGPLTLIFPANREVNEQITGNTGTVGVRISPHPLAAELVGKMAKPLTATSANISGLPPARSVSELLAMFQDCLDYILDGGETAAGLCSTVLGLRNGRLTVLRQGQVDLSEDLERLAAQSGSLR
jgi:L-threonylcarbamoyladenylate synthase